MNLLLDFINKRFLLSRDYLVVILTSVLLLISVIVLYLWLSYQTYLHNEKKEIIDASIKIVQSIEKSFNYSSHLRTYLSTQIAELPSKDDISITKLLRGELTSNPEVKNLFSWTLFDWIDSKNQLKSHIFLGNQFYNTDMSDREYIKYIRTKPRMLHFSKPAIGKPSGQWIIPAAFGVTDQHNNFIGAIGMGFSITNMQSSIEKTLSDNDLLSYIVINDELDVIIPSSKLQLDKTNKHLKELGSYLSLPKNSDDEIYVS